jgi:hypothetical protein
VRPYNRGAANPRAAVTEDQVHEIRALGLAGVRQREIGAAYGISSPQVSSIITRRFWKHLPDPTPEEAAAVWRRWNEQRYEAAPAGFA